MIRYFLKAVDRGLIDKVPVVDLYLLRDDNGVQSGILHSVGHRLTPATVNEVCQAFGELGVSVEREDRSQLNPEKKPCPPAKD